MLPARPGTHRARAGQAESTSSRQPEHRASRDRLPGAGIPGGQSPGTPMPRMPATGGPALGHRDRGVGGRTDKSDWVGAGPRAVASARCPRTSGSPLEAAGTQVVVQMHFNTLWVGRRHLTGAAATVPGGRVGQKGPQHHAAAAPVGYCRLGHTEAALVRPSGVLSTTSENQMRGRDGRPPQPVRRATRSTPTGQSGWLLLGASRWSSVWPLATCHLLWPVDHHRCHDNLPQAGRIPIVPVYDFDVCARVESEPVTPAEGWTDGHLHPRPVVGGTNSPPPGNS